MKCHGVKLRFKNVMGAEIGSGSRVGLLCGFLVGGKSVRGTNRDGGDEAGSSIEQWVDDLYYIGL